jgi:LPXTG-site transpeptidase (sortase) family protein
MYIQVPKKSDSETDMERPRFGEDVRRHPWRYIAGGLGMLMFCIVFFLTAGERLLPKTLQTAESETVRSASEDKKDNKEDEMSREMPLRVIIEKAGVDSRVYSPKETDIPTLDNYLTKGAVHYPGSGFPGIGNMFLFGHSTSLSVVRNQAYKTFNNIQYLSRGDVIKVYTQKHIYHYAVTTVREARAEEVFVDLNRIETMLTISTCNTFGAKEDRFIVEAGFVERTVVDETVT